MGEIYIFHYSSSESEEEKVSKKEHVPLIFKNKKEAMEAFKSLLRDKVKILMFKNTITKCVGFTTTCAVSAYHHKKL